MAIQELEEIRSSRIRCSSYSRAMGEDMAGTVKPVDLWLLLEYRGRWDREAISAFSPEIQGRLSTLKSKTPKMRLALIKQPDRKSGPLKVFWAFSREHRSQLFQQEIADYAELTCESDKMGVETEELVIGVCTHGTHDLCCAEFGNKIYSELRRAGRNVWQISHIGGCRFAPNVVCLPHGIVYGRVDPPDCAVVVENYRDGRIVAEKLRGRSCYSKPVQAAERFLRIRENVTGLDELRVADATEHQSDSWIITFLAGPLTYKVSVRIESGQTDTYKSCSANTLSPRETFTLLSLAVH